jgi:hypothetical protein
MDPYYSKYIKYKSKYDDLKLKNGINTSENNSKSTSVIKSNNTSSAPIRPVTKQSNNLSDMFEEILPTSTPTSPIATQPVTTQPVTTQPVAAQPVTTQPDNLSDIFNGILPTSTPTSPIATQPVTTQPVAAQPVTTQPVTTQPDNLSDVFNGILATSTPTSPVATQPVINQPIKQNNNNKTSDIDIIANLKNLVKDEIIHVDPIVVNRSPTNKEYKLSNSDTSSVPNSNSINNRENLNSDTSSVSNNNSPTNKEYKLSNSDTSSVSNSDSTSNQYKVIDGVKYSNLEEYQSRIACWFETCGLTWDKTNWSN